MQGYISYPNMIDDIPVDVILSNSHIMSADVTKNTLENGVKISEHVVLEPRILSVSFQQTNVSGGAERARNVWGQFKQIYEDRDYITVITEHEIYENMIISNMTGLESAPFKGALSCTLTLTQINFVNLQYVQVPESNLLNWEDEDRALFGNINTQKTASSPINGGSQSGIEVIDWQTVFSGSEQIQTPLPSTNEMLGVR
jgi:hypothetical protein